MWPADENSCLPLPLHVNCNRLSLLMFTLRAATEHFCFSMAADHGRADWLAYWDEFVQKARFIKLACLCHIKQNNLNYLGRVCTPCLSVSTGIYDMALLWM